MVELRKQEVKEKVVQVVTKEALIAKQCDCCGVIFNMERYCNDRMTPSIMEGTFAEYHGYAVDEDGDSLGNGFSAIVCSLKCADKLFTGGWKEIPRYKPFVKVDAILTRIEIGMTSLIKYEDELIKEWEES